jgi:hypothetical protein
MAKQKAKKPAVKKAVVKKVVTPDVVDPVVIPAEIPTGPGNPIIQPELPEESYTPEELFKEVIEVPAQIPEVEIIKELTVAEKIEKYRRSRKPSDSIIQRVKGGPFVSDRTGVMYVPVTIFK